MHIVGEDRRRDREGAAEHPEGGRRAVGPAALPRGYDVMCVCMCIYNIYIYIYIYTNK